MLWDFGLRYASRVGVASSRIRSAFLVSRMAAVQAEDIRAFFLFLGYLKGHHQEWLGSTTTNRHGVAAFDFATVSGCDQLVVGPTHHVVEHLTSWWLMSLPEYGLLLYHRQVSQITPLCRQSFRWLRRFQTCMWVEKLPWNIKSIIVIMSVLQYGICPGVTFDLMIILLRFLMNICTC